MSGKIYKKEDKDGMDGESSLAVLIDDLKRYGDIVGVVEFRFKREILEHKIQERLHIHYDKNKYTIIGQFARLFYPMDKFLFIITSDSTIVATKNSLSKAHMKRIENQAGAEAL